MNSETARRHAEKDRGFTPEVGGAHSIFPLVLAAVEMMKKRRKTLRKCLESIMHCLFSVRKGL